jgi:hypothetical protein
MACCACVGGVCDTPSRDSCAHITKNIYDAAADFDTGERPEEIRGGGVKYMWQHVLGDFRQGKLAPLTSVSDKKVVIDVSSWVHSWMVYMNCLCTDFYSSFLALLCDLFVSCQA